MKSENPTEKMNEMDDLDDIRIVVIGGGHGLSAVLRGIKKFSAQLTAIVTVADDGGSSGALRRDLGILPPGDIRSCLAALSADEEFLTQVLRYRFPSESSISGHNLGNLLLTALANITGSFEQGIQELARILAIRGHVTPSTLEDVNLIADIETTCEGEKIVEHIFGESSITERKGKVFNLEIEPADVAANPEAIKAILAADLIALGPGSLYTSVLPNLKVKGIAQALRAAHGKIVYICNVSTQQGETNNFTCYDHAKVIQETLPELKIDGIICNNNHEKILPENGSWVKIESKIFDEFQVYQADLIDDKYPWRHDSDKLAKMLLDTYFELVTDGNH